jgi:glycosyl-4,4'-diaponeurosporenoate acyltransferase
VTRSLTVVVVADAAAWCAVQVGAGYLAHRLPDEWLARRYRLLAPRRWEDGGNFYRRHLRIRRWKRWLPEGGAVFRAGFDKRTLPSTASADLARYELETRRAELSHWFAVAPLPLFVLWNPVALWPAMAAYAVLANGPCIAAQRYNRLRLERVLGVRHAGVDPSVAARCRNDAGTIGSSIP